MSNKFDLTMRLASRLLTLPDGSWPETLQAESDLCDALPRGMTVEQALVHAAQRNTHVHPERMGWLRDKARVYTEAEGKRLFPALA